jgi:two-component system response regulator FixJ
MGAVIKKYILVVDDEMGRKLIRLAIKNLRDIEIIETDTVQSALEAIAQYNIKVILTDIVLGEPDGKDLVSIVRNKGLETSVIFVASQADKNLAIKAVRLKAFDFIEKPFQNDILLAAVEKALASSDSEFLPKLENLNLNFTQIRVLEMVMKGLSNKEIADIVNLSEQGVKYHVGNLFKRFESSNRSTLRSKIWEIIGV